MLTTRHSSPAAPQTGGRGRSPVRRLLAALTLAIAALVASAPAGAVPSGFTDSLVVKVPNGPTELAWTPDGRMLIGTKLGQIRVFKNGALLATPAIDLSSKMCVISEQGLQGVAVHPNFATNHFVYVYWAFTKSGSCDTAGLAVNRVSRFVLSDASTIDPATEVVLTETPGSSIHNGGNLGFGKDGMLYVTTGDGGTSASSGVARDPGQLRGKVLRVTDSGGIPAGNAFTGSGTARCNQGGRPPSGSPSGTKCQEIYAMGLRNPFRAAFDPNASGVKLYINDVGLHSWEEINLGASGADYGWPTREGPCVRASTTDCGPPPAGVTNPLYAYQHGPDGAAITGGAFVPSGVWPAPYSGAYMFADYVFGEIYRLVPKDGGGFTQADFGTAETLTTLRFGPHAGGQALYYTIRDAGGEVRRITFTGAGSNRPPAAVAEASPTSGPAPLAVAFDARNSSDPDGDSLSYAWAFGDGTSGSGATPSHTYEEEGTFTAVVTVSDGKGGSDTASVRIDSGNRPPAPVIDAPAAGAKFAVGDAFTLTGHATDPEDGTLATSRLSWEVLRHHATHTHPFLEPTPGNGIPITGPDPEDLDASRNSYLEIRLTATDSQGVSTTVSQALDPKKVNLTFATSPSGLTINAGNVILSGPQTIPSWEKFVFAAEAPNQTKSGIAYSFGSWSDGGAQTHDITTPAAPATYTASFSAAGGGGEEGEAITPVADTYVSQAAPTTNFGTATSLRTDGEPILRGFLRFNVSGVESVEKAVLRIWSSSSHSQGYDVRSVQSTSWSETGITYNAGAPAFGSSVAGSSGPLAPSTWSEVDVTSLVVGNGLVSFALTPRSNTAMTLSSREAGARAPQLVITGSGGGGGEPTDTPLPAVADSYVKQDAATTNYGKSLSLRTDAQPVLNSYLRFDLGSLGPDVSALKLRLYANSANSVGFRVHRLDDDSWGESILTFANAPTPLAVVGSSGPVSAGAFKEVALSGVPTADQFLSLVISSTSTTATSFASREAGANAPQLIVTTGG